MGAYGTKYFEMVRANTIDNTKTASGVIVAGRGVYISGNGTVAQMSSTTTTKCYGIALEAASASGKSCDILIKGVVSVLADSSIATIVVDTQGQGMTYKTLAYIDPNGKWSSTADTATNSILGRVINQLISTIDAERVEIAINVGAFFTPTE